MRRKKARKETHGLSEGGPSVLIKNYNDNINNLLKTIVRQCQGAIQNVKGANMSAKKLI